MIEKQTQQKMKHTVKNTNKRLASILVSIYFIVLVLWSVFLGAEYAFTSQKVYYFMGVYELLIVFVPFVWLFMIDNKKVRIVLTSSYIAILVCASPFIYFLSIWSVGDLFDGRGNGWRMVHRQPIDSSQFLAIYRTPDQGALGGDTLAAAQITPIFSGLIHRHVISFDLIREFELDRNTPIDLRIDDFHLNSASPNELYTRGNLKP